MIITDAKLRQFYEQATLRGLPPDGMPLLKEFVKALFESLPTAGYIDENNSMNFDEYMLDGKITSPLINVPELEKDNESFPPF